MGAPTLCRGGVSGGIVYFSSQQSSQPGRSEDGAGIARDLGPLAGAFRQLSLRQLRLRGHACAAEGTLASERAVAQAVPRDHAGPKVPVSTPICFELAVLVAG